jgi:hypothetical protein
MWWDTLLRATKGPIWSDRVEKPENKRYKYAFQPEYVRQYPPDLKDVEDDPRWAQRRPARRFAEMD